MDENKDLEQVESEEQKPAENAKKKNIITIIVCAAVVIIAVIVAVCVLSNGKDDTPTGENETTTEAVSYETVTDASGEAVTDAEGNTVTQPVPTTQGGSASGNGGSGNGGSQGGSSGSSGEIVDKETTTSKKAEKRTLNIYVKTPKENGIADKVVIYVNGEEDSRYDIVLDGNEYLFKTESKYKGDAEVKVVLESYNVFWTLTIGELYDTETFNMPLNHVEEGFANIE